MSDAIDVVFSFDDTGSMSPCIAQVRRVVDETTKHLFNNIDNLRIGIIVHGDYCDGPEPVVTLNPTDDRAKISAFVNQRRSFHGGDAPECYEQVLHDARAMHWRAGKHKVLVLIGDNIPHPATYHLNKQKLDWKNELGLLRDQGVHVYGVQALGYREAERFYGEMDLHLRLEQFSQIPDLVQAICYQQAGKLDTFEKTLKAPAPSFIRIMDTLAGRKVTQKKTRGAIFKDCGTAIVPLESWKFQILPVDTDTPIKEFVIGQGLEWTKGNGYYEFTKTETIQDYKQVVLQDRNTEEFYQGADARRMLELPITGSVRIKPEKGYPYRFFVQSTSVNRKLKAGTDFLYMVDTSR